MNAWNRFSVRIDGREVQASFELSHGFLSQQVLDFLGIIVDVVGREIRCVREVQLPQTMVAYDRRGLSPPFRGKVNGASRRIEADELVVF
jgi:hypothetical protein